jgi:hypothetical protein
MIMAGVAFTLLITAGELTLAGMTLGIIHIITRHTTIHIILTTATITAITVADIMDIIIIITTIIPITLLHQELHAIHATMLVIVPALDAVVTMDAVMTIQQMERMVVEQDTVVAHLPAQHMVAHPLLYHEHQ